MRGDPFFSSKFLIAAAALIGALGTVPARAQINSVGGRLVLPVDEDCGVECDDEADATLKSSVRSQGGELGRAMQRAIQNGSAFLPAGATPVSGSTARGQGPGGGTPGPNTQVNDPGLDHVQTFDPAVVVTRPFEFSTQSETSAICGSRERSTASVASSSSSHSWAVRSSRPLDEAIETLVSGTPRR